MPKETVTMPKISTRYKVAVGYILLTIMLIATMGYIYHSMLHLTLGNPSDEQLSIRRGVANEIMNDLNRAEIVVQAIAIGKTGEYEEYKEIMESVDRAIDSLQEITTDLQNRERLETISMFINMKNSNMERLMAIIGSNDIGQLYSREIGNILSLQDSLMAAYGKFRYPRSVADTIANRLKNIQYRVSANYSRQANMFNSQMQSLRLSSLLLNDEVRLLLNEMDNEERLLEKEQVDKNEQVRNRAYMTISGIAIISVLLVAFFMFFIWRDISRSNHYRIELEKAKKRAEDLLDAKEKLMLTITHDIKAPVGSIIGYAELLDNITTGERQQFYLRNMQGAANHLLQLVNSLLDIHRLDVDKMDQQHIPFNAKELFDGIVGNYRPIAVNRNIELLCHCDSSVDGIFTGDPLRIRQITENLVGNAIKFTAEGSVSLDVLFADGRLHIKVSDTGCGIAPHDMERIFKEFTRLENAQGKEGFGLGLAITNKLVRLLGGNITVESEVGSGTSFRVILPVEKTSALPSEMKKISESTDIPRADILLIDDDKLQLKMMEAMLYSPSLTVTACSHPDELFIHLQQQRYDVIITDIQMPAMNGIDLIGRIRELPGAKDIPVVAMTARSDMDSDLLSRYGFATCLHKPFTGKELLRIISDVVETECGKLDFGQLTAFSMDDEAARKEIMETFIVETRKKRKLIEQAREQRDIGTATAVAHQLLPLFVMVGAVSGKGNLEWFEERREEKVFTDEAGVRITAILADVDTIIYEAEKELNK